MIEHNNISMINLLSLAELLLLLLLLVLLPLLSYLIKIEYGSYYSICEFECPNVEKGFRYIPTELDC
jgi:hypothetical protein